jgi:hypothetical protein
VTTVLAFDLNRFRELAFGRPSLPDHPLRDASAVEKMREDLPVDALAGLAELTHWASSVNTDDSFSPEQRSRVLLALDSTARPCWGELANQYLAPDGLPAEDSEGNDALLRALLDSATEFASGYGLCLQVEGRTSRWMEKTTPTLALMRARWLGRQFTLASMLHLPNIDDIWEDLHLLYALAEARGLWRKATIVTPGKSLASSVKQEYTRVLLMYMADLETLRGRQIELAYRITGRIAARARLELEPIPGAICAIEPHGTSRPAAVRRISGSNAHALYLDTFNCLPRLKAMLERDMDADLSNPDTMFGSAFTLRERNAMVSRLIDLWGSNPPQRRAKRVPLRTAALLHGGFGASAAALRPLDQGEWKARAEPTAQIRIVLDDARGQARPASLGKTLEETRVRLVDASVAGLGLLVPRREAAWARLGTLVSVLVEPGPEWVVGVLRRIGAEGESLRLGVAVLSRQPKVVWFRLEATGYASVWEEETRREHNFLEHFQRGILIDADRAPLGPGEMLVAPGVADRGSRLDIPFARGCQRIRVTAVREETKSFCRIAFESLGVVASEDDGSPQPALSHAP